MPTEKQIAAQLKREKAQLKKDTITFVIESVMSILHGSSLYGSTLWPKNGFKLGYHGTEELDTITIGVNIVVDSEYKKVRFNIWGKEARVLKQRKQLVLIFDQALYDGIYFFPEYPDFINNLMCHSYDDRVMDMLDFKFTLEN